MWKAAALVLGVFLSVIVDIQCQENDESSLHSDSDLSKDIAGLKRGLMQLKTQLASLRVLQNERDATEIRDKSHPATFTCSLNTDAAGMNTDVLKKNSSLGSLEERVVKLEKQANYDDVLKKNSSLGSLEERVVKLEKQANYSDVLKKNSSLDSLEERVIKLENQANYSDVLKKNSLLGSLEERVVKLEKQANYSDLFKMNSSLGSLEERVVKLEKQANYDDVFKMNSSLGSLEERVVKLEKQANYDGSFSTPCTSAMDCPFHGSSCQCGSCECSLGYSYDKSTGGCVRRCAVYGDTFVKRLDHGVVGCNTLTSFTPTGDGCMDACREQTDFVCISAEYQPSSRKCHMCDEPWYDIDPEKRRTDDFGWILYYRNCAI